MPLGNHKVNLDMLDSIISKWKDRGCSEYLSTLLNDATILELIRICKESKNAVRKQSTT